MRMLASTPYVLLALAMLSGCASWTYDQTPLGTPLREAQRRIPEELILRADRSIALLDEQLPDRADAVVLLLAPDARVAGKLQAQYRAPAFLAPGAYTLRAELDPGVADMTGLGPLDTLRAVADDLTNVRPEQQASSAHAWVAAGLIRVIQRWPEAGDAGPAYPRLTETLELVPGGGEAQLQLRPDGVYEVSYTAPTSR